MAERSGMTKGELIAAWENLKDDALIFVVTERLDVKNKVPVVSAVIELTSVPMCGVLVINGRTTAGDDK